MHTCQPTLRLLSIAGQLYDRKGAHCMSEWMTSEDRAEAIAILQHLLTPEQLRRVIDPEIERFVARTENAGPRKLHKTRIDDEEFASFLLDLLGTELLRVPTLRREILASLPEDQLIHLASSNGGTPGPNREACIEQIMKIRWHPGGPWPRYIASFLGLRKIFAGIPASPDTPAEEVVEARLRLPDLHDYQQDLVHQVHQLLAAPPGENRAILCLPTGAGKTRTAVQALLTAWNLDKQEIPFILWVAQSDELCEQAAEA